MLKRCAFVLVLASCGGSKAGHKEPVAPAADKGTPMPVATAISDCATAAEHVAGVVITTTKPKVSKAEMVNVIKTRCETDAWSADAKKCFSQMREDYDAIDTCVKLLTKEQNDRVMADAKLLADEKTTKDQLDEGKMGKRDVAPPAEPQPKGGRCAPGNLNASGNCDCPAGYASTDSTGTPRCVRAAKSAPRAPSAPKPKPPPAKGGGAPAKGDPCEGGE